MLITDEEIQPLIEQLLKVDEEIQEHYSRMHSILVSQKNRILFERYYNNFTKYCLHDLRSATKSVLALILGVAAKEGYLPPLDQPLHDTLKKYTPERSDFLWKELTLRHLLSMTSGFQWKTGARLGEAHVQRFHRSENWSQFIMNQPIDPRQHGHFRYCSLDSHLLSILLTEWTGVTALEFANKHLFGPLGIHQVKWDSCPDGYSTGHIGLHLTATDMMKLGQLCLDQGHHNGVPLLHEQWIKELIKPLSDEISGYGRYGLHWWTSKTSGVFYAYAHGHGGQQIVIVPELKAVIIFTANWRGNRWKNPKPLLDKFIFPALKLGLEG